MTFFKILTFSDVSNLQKPSWIKGQTACHCNIILYTLFRIKFFSVNPFSPKIDFYVDLLICETSWASNDKFMLLSKIFQEIYYL